MPPYTHTACGGKFDSAAAAVVHLLIIRLARHTGNSPVVLPVPTERPAAGVGVA